MKTIKVKSKPQTCPKCNGKIVDIIYGEPSYELFEAAERGEVVLGGCCICVDENGNINDPSWECTNCHTTFIED